MIPLRLRCSISPCAAVLLCGCALWNPDHEPEPDTVLAALLADHAGQAGHAAAAPRRDDVNRERLRYEVERLATRHPNHVPSQVAAAAIALDGGDRMRAQAYADRALALAPADVEARTLRVRIAVADGATELARRLVDDGLRARPDAAALYESSAWLHQIDGEAEAALVALTLAERLGAPAWRVAFHRGLVEEQRGDDAAAERHYRAALDADAGCEAAAHRLAGLRARRPPVDDGGD